MKIRFVINLVLTLIFYFSVANAQNGTSTIAGSKVTCPEKWWAAMHPFVAGKAITITLDVLEITDSLWGEKNTEYNLTPQQADAFRHAFWMASLVQEIHWRKARSLGNAHERGNYRTFRKNIRQGKDDLHDEAAKQMDLWNNREGIAIGIAKSGSNRKELIQVVRDSIESGALKIIRTTASGKYLDCNGNNIAEENYKNKWFNDKCLVPSDAKQ
jgi:hypothetical protein